MPAPQAAPIKETFQKLKKYYPVPKTELVFEDPFQLLIAVILSAQCTDDQVNKATPDLFANFPTAFKLAKAPLKKVEKLVYSCGFYKNKAKNIILCSQSLVKQFDGIVPQTMDELVGLAGVGRKTASVVLNQAFDIPAIAVDTHVKRVAYRLGWTQQTDPVKVEFDLRDLLPKRHWIWVNASMVLHGRQYCPSRKPKCENCFLKKICPQVGV